MIELKVLEQRVRRIDPTQTTVLRNKFASEFYKRFRMIKGFINESIVTNDIFELKKLRTQQALSSEEFIFLTDPQRIQEFMEWLQREVYDGVYELYIDNINASNQQVISGQWWPDAYIREAYEKGISHSVSYLSTLLADDSFEFLRNSPVHVREAQMLYTRVYEELKGITSAMSQQIARILSDGIIAGENPNRLARAINKAIDDIGIRRARLLARTEIIRAHAEGTLNNFELARLENVELQAEFLTAGDDRVCPICSALSGKIYSIKEARGIIPVHPNCRCTWLPYDPEVSKLLGDRY
jgi:SPP1 gp7 family putative phage head morphogenesis protein